MSRHAIIVKNDFGKVVWDQEMEDAFILMRDAAWTLQMTDGEFMSLMAESDRECPKCKAGIH